MKGAIIFLVVFAIALLITLGSTTIPPGQYIYNQLNVPSVDYPILGIPATTLVISVFNGVIYGFIVWLLYTIAAAATGRGKKQPTMQQTVNVQLPEKEKDKEEQKTN